MFDALRILVSLEIYTRGRPHADNPSTTIDSNVLFFFFFFFTRGPARHGIYAQDMNTLCDVCCLFFCFYFRFQSRTKLKEVRSRRRFPLHMISWVST